MSPAARTLGARVEDVRAYLRQRALTAAGLWVGAGFAAVLALAWVVAGPAGWQQGSDVPAVLDGVALLIVVGVLVAYRSVAARWLAEGPLGDAIERAAGLRSGEVRGSMELAREVPTGVSTTLAGRAAERVVDGLGDRRPEELSGALGEAMTSWVRRGLGAFAAFALLAVALAVASPNRAAQAWSPLSRPLHTMKDPVLPPIEVTPGTVEVLRGSDVHLSILAPGRTEVSVAWQAEGDVARSDRVELAQGRSGHVFRSVVAPITYRVVGADGAASPQYEITPIDPLFVSDLVVSVAYPPYTGLTPDEYRGELPPLRLPAGTRLSFEGLASRPLTLAELRDSLGRAELTFDVSSNGFEGTWVPRRSGLYDWSFIDEAGDPAEIQPEPVEITVVPDQEPAVAIPLPGRDTILPMSLRQPLIIEAADDYGLRRLELVAYRVTAVGERLDPVVQGLDLGGTRAALARPLLDLRRWGLLPGDTVRYFARVSDNGPAAQTVSTREYILRMPGAAELQRATEAELEAMAGKLEELADEAARQAEENRDQALESAAKRGLENQPETGFEEREALEDALGEQEALSSEVDSLRAELEALERMMEEAGQADPALSEKLEELQQLLEELDGSELQKRMEELASALEEDDLRQANESLGELAEEQEAMRERLEESIERFKRAAVEQDFRATTQEAEDLARLEEALADAMREEDDPELRAEQQKQLTERADELQDRMERLEERLGEIEERDAQTGVQQAQQSLQQAQQQMQQTQQRAEQGENQQAGEQADEAAERLEQVAQELQEAQQQMAQEQAEQAQAALRQASDDALALARRQAELREQMRGASQERMAGMRGDEASLLQGVENMSQNLQLAANSQLQGQRELSAQMGLAMESIQKTIEAMENRRGASASPLTAAETAIGDLNQLALMALAGAEQMGQQGEGQSGQDVAEQLEQLAQQQGELMNQASQVMPMQLGQEAMAQQMQQMSLGQESVADELGDLSEEPGADEALGDLQQLAEEAAAIAQQLAQGRLTPEVAQRQERLFHRLLDAGRSLEREEFSDERESETPGAFDRGQVVPLTPEQLGALRYSLPGSDQLQSLSPALRQLVIQYFERLNRGGGG